MLPAEASWDGNRGKGDGNRWLELGLPRDGCCLRREARRGDGGVAFAKGVRGALPRRFVTSQGPQLVARVHM